VPGKNGEGGPGRYHPKVGGLQEVGGALSSSVWEKRVGVADGRVRSRRKHSRERLSEMKKMKMRVW